MADVTCPCCLTMREVSEAHAKDIARGRKSGKCVHCALLGNTRRRGTRGPSPRHPLRSVWANMKARCSNPKATHWAFYGGRGIKVCERWRNSFDTFVADMPGYVPGLTLERINNAGDYEPSNCRWATMAEQGTNRRSTRLITYLGRTQHLEAWAVETGISSGTIHGRIKRGWPLDQVFTVR